MKNTSCLHTAYFYQESCWAKGNAGVFGGLLTSSSSQACSLFFVFSSGSDGIRTEQSELASAEITLSAGSPDGWI